MAELVIAVTVYTMLPMGVKYLTEHLTKHRQAK